MKSKWFCTLLCAILVFGQILTIMAQQAQLPATQQSKIDQRAEPASVQLANQGKLGQQQIEPYIDLPEQNKIELSGIAALLLSEKENGYTDSSVLMPNQSIAAGNGHSLMITQNGAVMASGRGTHGQLGNGERTNSATPVQVKNGDENGLLTDVAAVQGGFLFSLALKEDGTLWTWGNAVGFMTDTGDSHSDIPVQVKDENGRPLTDIFAISAKGAHWLALKNDGTVWSWGGNEFGQLGNGGTEPVYNYAVQVRNADGTPLKDIVAIAAGAYHNLALKADGTVWSWGKNENGQLGNQSTENSSVPIRIDGLEGVAQIAAGEFHSMCMKSDGSVWAWGRNQYGQLGDNTRKNASQPVRVKGENGIGFLGGVTQIAAGYGFSAALLANGCVVTWGHNYAYQLGDGTQQSKNAPVFVQNEVGLGNMLNIEEISAGADTLLIRSANGAAWINGTNTYGAFGDGKMGTFSAFPKRAFSVSGPEYNLNLQGKYVIVTAKRMTDPAKRFMLTYHPSKLRLKYVATQQDAGTLTPGAYGSLQIDSAAAGEIVLGLNMQLPAGKSWSGAIAIFEIEQLTEDDETVSLEVL